MGGTLELIIDHFISRIIILGVQLARRANSQGAQLKEKKNMYIKPLRANDGIDIVMRLN